MSNKTYIIFYAFSLVALLIAVVVRTLNDIGGTNGISEQFVVYYPVLVTIVVGTHIFQRSKTRVSSTALGMRIVSYFIIILAIFYLISVILGGTR
jgi:hypothetical protein